MIFKKRLPRTKKTPYNSNKVRISRFSPYRRGSYIYLPTPKEKETSMGRKIIRSVFLFIFGFLLASAIYFVFFSPYLKIKNIILVGNKNITLEEVENHLKPILEENLLASNILFFKSVKASEVLFSKIPSLRSIIIKKNPPQALEIKVEERTPQLVWKTGDKSYFISEDGVVFRELSREISNLPLIVDEAKVPVELGGKTVSPKFVKFIKELVAKLPRRTKLEVDFIKIKEVTFDIEVVTKQKISLFMDSTRALDPQLTALTLVFQDAKKHGFGIWHYVDLRLENKVFYK